MQTKAKVIRVISVMVGLILTVAIAVAESQNQDESAGSRLMSEDIYFKYRDYAISPEAAENLKRKAVWLREHPDAIVIIEGHTDLRNGREANLAFGERRAGSVKSYLMRLGIDGARLKAVSYGEETPVDPGRDKAARAKNRRVHFVIESME